MNERYKDIFGEHTVLELKYKPMKVVISALNKILVPNPNNKTTEDLIDLKADGSHNITGLCMAGQINIMKYDFKEPEEPEEPTQEDSKYYEALKDFSKSMDANLHLLYWRAFDFFRNRGYYINKVNEDSIYLKITLENELSEEWKIKVANMNPRELKEYFEAKRFESIMKGNLERVVCGEINNYKIVEGIKKLDYLWVFPFSNEDSYIEGMASCYLLYKSETLKDAVNTENKKSLDTIMFNELKDPWFIS